MFYQIQKLALIMKQLSSSMAKTSNRRRTSQMGSTEKGAISSLSGLLLLTALMVYEVPKELWLCFCVCILALAWIIISVSRSKN